MKKQYVNPDSYALFTFLKKIEILKNESKNVTNIRYVSKLQQIWLNINNSKTGNEKHK